jgi:hypothetical protein
VRGLPRRIAHGDRRGGGWKPVTAPNCAQFRRGTFQHPEHARNAALRLELTPVAKRLKPDDKPNRRKRPRVTKLSPEQPAARDEGPRLLPLPTRAREDPAAGRLERYLSLADTAFGRPSGSTGQLTAAAAEAVSRIAEPAVTGKIEGTQEPAAEQDKDAPEAGSGPPVHPKLEPARRPVRPNSPKPPKMTLPKPPRRPSPPKLSAPKPPRRPR